MSNYTLDRALFASNALVYLAIAFGTLSFWTDAISAGPISEHVVDYIVAAGLTVAMMAASFLLSGCVIRFAEAKEKKAFTTAGLVVVLGAVLVLIEGGMTDMGLRWLNARKYIAPEWVLLVVSYGLSLFNVGSLYTFARDIKAPVKVETRPGKILADIRWGKKAA
jgi:hypothetical protein